MYRVVPLGARPLLMHSFWWLCWGDVPRVVAKQQGVDRDGETKDEPVVGEWGDNRRHRLPEREDDFIDEKRAEKRRQPDHHTPAGGVPSAESVRMPVGAGSC